MWEAEKNSTVRSLYPGKLPLEAFFCDADIQKKRPPGILCPRIKHMAQLPESQSSGHSRPDSCSLDATVIGGNPRRDIHSKNLRRMAVDTLDDLPVASFHFPGEAGAENGIHNSSIFTGGKIPHKFHAIIFADFLLEGRLL